MRGPSKSLPKYAKHKASGKAVVRAYISHSTFNENRELAAGEFSPTLGTSGRRVVTSRPVRASHLSIGVRKMRVFGHG